MKHMFTLKQLILSCLALIAIIFTGNDSQAQFLATSSANVDHGGGSGVSGPAPNFGAALYIDDAVNGTPIPAYPAGANGTYGYVASGGWIKFWWNFPAAVGTISKVVFYKNDRPVTNCTVEHWNGTNWTTVHTYNNVTNNIADSFFLTTPINISIVPNQDTVMISNIQSPTGNPSFREIQLWRLPACAGAPNVTVVGGTLNTTPVASPLNPCFGYTVYLQAQSPAQSTGHTYQWEVSNSSTGPWTIIPGANGPGYSFQALSTAYYRVTDTCANGGAYTTSAPYQVNVTQTQWQPIPYYMGFDNTWVTSSCLAATTYNMDLPDANGWSNDPPFGPNSWRSDTLVTIANSGWAGVSSNYYNPNSVTTPFSYPYGTKFPVGSRRYARLHSSHNTFLPGTVGNLDLYLNCSTPAGDKELYFYYINQGAINNDSLRVLMSLDLGATWTLLGSYDSAARMKKRALPIQSNNANTIIRFQGVRNSGNDNSDIGLDSVYVAPPCSGTPYAGKVSPASPVVTCAGTSLNLTALGATMAGGLVYTWEQSTDGGVNFTPVTGGTGYNSLFFVTPPIYDTILYRLNLQCGAAGTPVYSDTLTVRVTEPQYAAIPYRQSFESWQNKCSTNDVPVSQGSVINWTNIPATGNNSWRRNDQGTSAIWPTTSTGGVYSPTAGPTTSTGNQYSARFHSNGSLAGQTGNLDVLFDGSSVTGDKELNFYHINTSGNDSLRVFYSSDGGGNFTKLAAYGNNAAGWAPYKLQVPCNTATCVIRFQGVGESGNTSDIGLDSVRIDPPCSGAPNAGTISSAQPCSGANFTISLQGNTVTGGLTYIWEMAPAANGPWTPAPSTSTFLTTNISSPTYYRVRVKCVNSNLEDTTPVQFIDLASFYYCYCVSGATTSTGADIGNVTVRRMPGTSILMSNGVATPTNNNSTAIGTYSDYRITVPPIPMYHDSTFALFVSQINSGVFTNPGTSVTAWIDTSRNGVFEPDEIFMQEFSANNTNPPQRVDTQFLMANTAKVGITGMRIVMEQGSNPNPVPCGTYTNGETEDYLIDIRYPPCGGPASAGIAYISDTSSCVGYPVTMIDTSHEHKRYGINWLWQYSPDGFSWADISGSIGRDTVSHIITGQTYFRLRMICLITFDTTYSNVLQVNINPPYSCYCFSLADGNNLDSSDIGGVMLDSFAIYNSGPHLLNPTAFQARTDYTRVDTLHLWIDTTYQILVYHIQRSGFHADAKITLFMDLNNDLQYNVTPSYTELMWTGYSSASNFTVVDSVTIPPYAIPDVLTGMRLILNNNTGPNVPSDSACGPYTSGETEDYVVMFHKQWSVGVPDLGNISHLMVYPNPTEGRFRIRFDAKKEVEQATITITSITGQQIMKKQYLKPGKEFLEELDLSGAARGVYLVELKADDEKQMRKLIVK